MAFDHTSGILEAVRRADRARLLRFVAVAEPNHRWMLAGRQVAADAMPTACLRDSAFCIADRFWSHRRSARFWRAFHANPANTHRGAPAGHTTVPSYTGAALDAWLARPEPALFRDAA